MQNPSHWLETIETILIVVAPYGLWMLFCLFAINWKKMWPTLAEGAWVPVLLLLVLVALVCSRIRPSDAILFGVITVSNFWWQLMAALLLSALGLFAGWVQDRYSLAPFEYAVAPAAHGHDLAHGHDHASHDEHAPAHGHDHASHDEHAPAHGHDEHAASGHDEAAHH